MKIDEIMKRLTELCRLKHYSYATEKFYQGWIQSYSRALRVIPGGWSSEKKSRGVFDPNREAGSGDCHPESSVVRAGLPLRI